MKKPKNIPTYYNFPGTPVYRDTTALPFNYGGNLYPSLYSNSFADGGDLNNNPLPFEVFTWKGDADSYYRKNEDGEWEYLNSKTRNQEGRYNFKKVTDSKIANKLNRQAEINPNAGETLGKWMAEEVTPYIGNGTYELCRQEEAASWRNQGILYNYTEFPPIGIPSDLNPLGVYSMLNLGWGLPNKTMLTTGNFIGNVLIACEIRTVGTPNIYSDNVEGSFISVVDVLDALATANGFASQITNL
jgi:hypothetical protein